MYFFCIAFVKLHCKETKDSVELLLPFFRVKSIRNTLIKKLAEWPFQYTENEKLENGVNHKEKT